MIFAVLTYTAATQFNVGHPLQTLRRDVINVIPKKSKIQVGLYKDPVIMADDFDGPLPDDILEGFGYK